ncbi:MAG: methylmalonyl Co-A mutase-associated GTPase MeaB [Deltaproteobacteria bacterium]|nr:methylmalonyl Co-A mutase-associated GTPase MeaB [Deltaproteobacteria bacterium]
MAAKDPEFYIQGVRDGNRRILAKTITLIESTKASHQELAQTIMDRLLVHTGQAIRLGISGVPGAGKSYFIESLGTTLIEKGHKVAVLAVDPSSKRFGGSILADKTRMEKLSADRRAFIRPSPSSGTLGGVARKTRETMLVCEAAGFDVVLVETVGVGQSETTVASMVDFFLVLMLAGAGDELQGIKKGLLELADALAITKADGDNLERAKRAQKVYENAFHLLIPSSANWSPPIMTCSALNMTGIDDIWETVLRHRSIITQSGELAKKRRTQALDWMWSLVEEGLKRRFYEGDGVKNALPDIRRQVEKGALAPTLAADRLLFFLDKSQGDRKNS